MLCELRSGMCEDMIEKLREQLLAECGPVLAWTKCERTEAWQQFVVFAELAPLCARVQDVRSSRASDCIAVRVHFKQIIRLGCFYADLLGSFDSFFGATKQVYDGIGAVLRVEVDPN